MIKLYWQKTTDTVKAGIRSIKPLSLLMAFGYVDAERLEAVLKELAADDASVIVCVVTDEWFTGLEGSSQFKPADYADVMETLEKLEGRVVAANKLAVLKHESQNIKYIIRELQPGKIVRFNGTWADVMHYQKEFWEAYYIGQKIEVVSPFASEESAVQYAEKVDKKNKQEFEKYLAALIKSKKGKLTDSDFLAVANKISYLSWDWTGRTGAVLVQDGEVVSWSENVVVPYQSYIFHEGALREKTHAPVGENVEMGETNHAESGCIVKALKSGKKVDVAKCVLYTSKFPCPVCARIVADFGVKEIVYEQEYVNEIGYKVLSKAGVNCRKLIS